MHKPGDRPQAQRLARDGDTDEKSGAARATRRRAVQRCRTEDRPGQDAAGGAAGRAASAQGLAAIDARASWPTQRPAGAGTAVTARVK